MAGKKIWVSMLTGLLLIGIGGVCLGDMAKRSGPPSGSMTGNNSRSDHLQPSDPGGINRDLQKNLTELTVAKAITEKQEASSREYFEENDFQSNQPQPPDMLQTDAELQKEFDKLVVSSVITKKQEATILGYYERVFKKVGGRDLRSGFEPRAKLKKAGKEPLGLLIKDGVINHGQAYMIVRLLYIPPAQLSCDHPKIEMYML